MKIGVILPSKIKDLPSPIYMYFEMVGLRNSALIFFGLGLPLSSVGGCSSSHSSPRCRAGPPRSERSPRCIHFLYKQQSKFTTCKYFRRCTLRDFNEPFLSNCFLNAQTHTSYCCYNNKVRDGQKK